MINNFSNIKKYYNKKNTFNIIMIYESKNLKY